MANYKEVFKPDEQFEREVSEADKENGNYLEFSVPSSDEGIDKLASWVGSRANPFIVYIKMRNRTFTDDKGRLVLNMSLRKMAKEFKISVNSVIKAIGIMEDIGWVEKENPPDINRLNEPTTYIFGTLEEL